MCFHGNCMIISQHNKNVDEKKQFYKDVVCDKSKKIKDVHNYLILSFN